MHKPYLVKVYENKTGDGEPNVTTRLADDRPDSFSKESVWYWMNEAANGRIKACFFAMTDVPDAPEDHAEIFIAGKMGYGRQMAKNLKIADLKADSSVKAYLLTCVLDLS